MRRWSRGTYADHTSRSRRAESPRACSGYALKRRAPHRASRQGPRPRLAGAQVPHSRRQRDGEARRRGRCGARRALRSRTVFGAIPGVDFRDCDPRRSHITSGASVRLACAVQVHPLVDAGASVYERRTRSRRVERAPTASLAVPPSGWAERHASWLSTWLLENTNRPADCGSACLFMHDCRVSCALLPAGRTSCRTPPHACSFPRESDLPCAWRWPTDTRADR